MKVKAYKWSPSKMNTVVQCFHEIEQVNNSMLYKTLEMDDEDNFDIFAIYKGVYFWIATIKKYRYDDLIQKGDFDKVATVDDVVINYLSGYPNFLVLKVIELSGDDIKPYQEIREAHLKKQAERDEMQRKERENRDAEREAREKEEQQERFKNLKANLIADKLVLMEDLIEYAKFHDIKIHPRTLGSIYKNNGGLEVSQTMVRHFHKKTRRSTLVSFTKLAQSIVETF